MLTQKSQHLAVRVCLGARHTARIKELRLNLEVLDVIAHDVIGQTGSKLLSTRSIVFTGSLPQLNECSVCLSQFQWSIGWFRRFFSLHTLLSNEKPATDQNGC